MKQNGKPQEKTKESDKRRAGAAYFERRAGGRVKKVFKTLKVLKEVSQSREVDEEELSALRRDNTINGEKPVEILAVKVVSKDVF